MSKPPIYAGFEISRGIWIYRPWGCFTALLVVLGAPLTWFAALFLLALGGSGWLHTAARDAAWGGGIMLVVCALCGLSAWRKWRQITRGRG